GRVSFVATERLSSSDFRCPRCLEPLAAESTTTPAVSNGGQSETLHGLADDEGSWLARGVVILGALLLVSLLATAGWVILKPSRNGPLVQGPVLPQPAPPASVKPNLDVDSKPATQGPATTTVASPKDQTAPSTAPKQTEVPPRQSIAFGKSDLMIAASS